MSAGVRLVALRVGGDPEHWRDLGFHVDVWGVAHVGSVRVELLPAVRGGAIVSWVLEGCELPPEASLDGLATEPGTLVEVDAVAHPNGALQLDHVVVFTPSLERTTAVLEQLGVSRRRLREPGGGVRQGFFRLGEVILEVVEGVGLEPEEPARFWGLVAVVADIEHAAAVLGPHLGAVKDAVQPGRRIATVRPEACGGLPLALITPAPSRVS